MPRRTTGDPKTSNARINRQTSRLYWQQIRRYKNINSYIRLVRSAGEPVLVVVDALAVAGPEGLRLGVEYGFWFQDKV